jgi:hypothetical protein
MDANLQGLVKRYVALWNEGDPQKRRRDIETLWRPGGSHFTPTRAFAGFDALEVRVQEAHSEFVERKGCVFRPAGDPAGHHDIVKFYWEMIDAQSDNVRALGFDVLQLDSDGKIISDHQFIEPLPS